MSTSCKKSPELATDYIPTFNGSVEANVTITNLTLKASFTGLNITNAEKFGFEISEKDENINVEYSVTQLGSTEMILKIDTALRASVNFKTRAWIIVGSKKFYSEYAYFTGLGFPAPEITSLSKEYAFRGEVFYICGKYFTDNFENNQIIVKIDNILCQVVSATYFKIGVKMPDTKTKGKVKILLNVFGKNAVNEFEIENYWPEIFSVTPQSMPLNGEITIKGKFHSEYINTIFPVQDDHQSYNIVKYTDDEIILKSGDYMNCDSLFSIYLSLPDYNYFTYEYVNTGFSIKRTGNWQMLENVPFYNTNYNYIYFGGSCLGKGYVIQTRYYLPDIFLFWRYDPQVDDWTNLPSFPGNYRFNPVFVEYNGLLYYGLGNSSQGEIMTDFWKFDPVTNNWTKCADLNLKSTYSNTIFGGIIQDAIVVFSDLNNQKAQYDPFTNTWEISDCEVPFTFYANKQMFINDGKYYFIAGSQIFLYNPSSNSFNIYYEAVDYTIPGPVFTAGNRVFSYGGCKVGEIDMINKRSFIVNDLSNYLSKESYPTSLFAINGVTYFFISPNKLCKLNLAK